MVHSGKVWGFVKTPARPRLARTRTRAGSAVCRGSARMLHFQHCQATSLAASLVFSPAGGVKGHGLEGERISFMAVVIKCMQSWQLPGPVWVTLWLHSCLFGCPQWCNIRSPKGFKDSRSATRR